MSSEAKTIRRPCLSGPVVIALGVLACSGNTDVSCAPTLTCTLNEARFEPPPEEDAGTPPCTQLRRCRSAQITAGGAHTCALSEAAQLFCWGSDEEGQLAGRGLEFDAGAGDADGNSEESDDGDAGVMAVVEGIEQVSAGGAHTCAVTDEKQVLCWGRDAEGQVSGVAESEPARDPVMLEIADASQVAAGGVHTCAVTGDGVVCWGSARFGQAGREVSERALPPELVAGTAGAVEVVAGVRHSCARLSSGRVVCWGELIDEGSLEPLAHPEPVPVSGLEDATQLAAGAGHSCALRATGDVVCWGSNGSGQLGDGTTRASAIPVAVEGLELALHVGAGGAERDGVLVGHSCAITKSFLVQCWGRNAEGQLGIGSAPDSSKPVVVLSEADEEDDEPYLEEATRIALGGYHSCELDNDGPVRCWGDDSEGQLGTTERVVFGRPVTARLGRRRR